MYSSMYVVQMRAHRSPLQLTTQHAQRALQGWL